MRLLMMLAVSAGASPYGLGANSASSILCPPPPGVVAQVPDLHLSCAIIQLSYLHDIFIVDTTSKSHDSYYELQLVSCT